MKNRNKFFKFGLFMASVIGCLSFMGCIKTEDLLNNTFTEEKEKYEISQSLIFNLSVPDAEADYRYSYSDTETVITDKNEEGNIVYRNGKILYTVTNTVNEEKELEQYLYSGDKKGVVHKEDDRWYYDEREAEFFDKDAYKAMFQNAKVKKVTVNDVKYDSLQVEIPLTECPYFCNNDFLKAYAESFTLQLTHYYDVSTHSLLCIKAFYLPDTDKLVSLYEANKIYSLDITAFVLEKGEMTITPSASDISLKEQYETEEMEIYLEEGRNTINDIQEKINEENKLGYYLEDGSFSFSKPVTGKLSWEYRDGDTVLGRYNKEDNTYTDIETGTVTNDYYKKAESMEDGDVIIDANESLLLFEGSDAADKTLYELWNETFGMKKKPDRAFLIGFEAKDSFLDSEYAVNTEDFFYNRTIRDILGMTKKWNSLNSEVKLAVYHLATDYNIGLYTDEDGNIVSFKDVIILSGVEESSFDALQTDYQEMITRNSKDSTTVVYDENGEIIKEE